MAPCVQGDLVEWASLLGLTAVALLEDEMIRVLASILKPDDEDATAVAVVAVSEPRIPFSADSLRAESLYRIAASARVPLASVVSLVASTESRLLLVAVPGGVAIAGESTAAPQRWRRGPSAKIREVMGRT